LRELATVQETTLITLDPGTYYIRLASVTTNDLSSYAFTVDTNEGNVAADDHGDDNGSATMVTSGVVTAGKIGTVGDVDYFSFVLPSTGNISVAYEAKPNDFGNTRDIEFEVYDSSDTQLYRESTFTSATDQINSQPAGTYYVRISSLFSSDLSAYEFTVTY
jgi:hypothetical protein